MSFHFFTEEGGHEYGSFEVFRVPENDAAQPLVPGWYWWPCFPGCMPDGDARGPFKDEQSAIKDAQGD